MKIVRAVFFSFLVFPATGCRREAVVAPPVVVAPAGASGQDRRAEETIIARDTIARERSELAPSETAALLERIQSAKPEGMDTLLWEHEVNSTLNALRAQPEVVPGLTDALLTMAADSDNPVLRLYALQHVAQIHSRETPAAREQIEQALVAHAMDDDRKMAGAALVFLGDIDATSLSDETRGQLAARAVALVRDPDSPSDVRISAIHACVAAGYKEALPGLRETVADASANVVERRAAIHALGRLGGQDELALLTSLLPDHPSLEPALRPAITGLSPAP
jgi:HEAT repeat protein